MPNPNATIFSDANAKLAKRGIPYHEGEDLLNPPYAINNTAGVLSNLTAHVGLSLLTYNIRLLNECWICSRIRFMQMGSLSMIHVSRNTLSRSKTGTPSGIILTPRNR